MRAFRILLALAVAGATFYSLNVLAMRNGYPDRLDFKNKHYHERNCEQHRNHGFSHHNSKPIDTVITPIDSLNR